MGESGRKNKSDHKSLTVVHSHGNLNASPVHAASPLGVLLPRPLVFVNRSVPTASWIGWLLVQTLEWKCVVTCMSPSLVIRPLTADATWCTRCFRPVAWDPWTLSERHFHLFSPMTVAINGNMSWRMLSVSKQIQWNRPGWGLDPGWRSWFQGLFVVVCFLWVEKNKIWQDDQEDQRCENNLNALSVRESSMMLWPAKMWCSVCPHRSSNQWSFGWFLDSIGATALVQAADISVEPWFNRF